MRTALEAMLAPSDEPPRKCKKTDASAKSAEAIPQTTFTELVANVRTGMPSGEQSTLTVAIAFICTLHMCNEHNLELDRTAGDAFGDFRITKPADFSGAGAGGEEEAARGGEAAEAEAPVEAPPAEAPEAPAPNPTLCC